MRALLSVVAVVVVMGCSSAVMPMADGGSDAAPLYPRWEECPRECVVNDHECPSAPEGACGSPSPEVDCRGCVPRCGGLELFCSQERDPGGSPYYQLACGLDERRAPRCERLVGARDAGSGTDSGTVEEWEMYCLPPGGPETPVVCARGIDGSGLPVETCDPACTRAAVAGSHDECLYGGPCGGPPELCEGCWPRCESYAGLSEDEPLSCRLR